jgi:5-methylthioadenosine/S-adenosylhomocysteine deaminase
LKNARALANKYNVPFQIHLAETAWEFDNCIKNHNTTPTKYLADNGILEGRTIGAHVVYASEEDLELLLQTNTGVATNPVSNMKLASGIAPVPAFLQRGITVGIGTDGVVSNNNLDMFEEMKTLALIHKQHNSNPSLISARQALRMATIDGAKLFGLDDKIGSLEIGKKADMIIVNINQPHMMPLYNIESQLVYSAKGADVETVIVNGKVLVENKQALYINEIELMLNTQKIAYNVMEFLNNKV